MTDQTDQPDEGARRVDAEVPQRCLSHDAPWSSQNMCSKYRGRYEQANADVIGGTDDLVVPAMVLAQLADLGPCSWAPGRWPEPHDGIVPVVRDDDLLSLEPEALRRRRLMIVMAAAFEEAVTVADKAPKVARLHRRFVAGRMTVSNAIGPRPGDLVVEQSALCGGRYAEATEVEAFGILLARRTEWATPLADWEAWVAENSEDGTAHREAELISYVQYGPGPDDVCRWENSSFVALPTTRDALEEQALPLGARTADGVTVNRDELLGHLADSGIDVEQVTMEALYRLMGRLIPGPPR